MLFLVVVVLVVVLVVGTHSKKWKFQLVRVKQNTDGSIKCLCSNCSILIHDTDSVKSFKKELERAVQNA